VLGQAGRFNVLTCGRRWGKTMIGVRLGAEPALDGFPVGWFAPTYKVLDDAWGDLRDALAPVTSHKDEAKYRIELVGGGLVECWSLKNNPDAGRGRKYKRVIVDEAAMIPNLERAWTQSIRPTLTDLRGDAWFLSSPKGMGYYKALHDRGQDDKRPTWRSWQRPTLANPFIEPAEVEDARGDLPERVFAQEYEAAFLDFEGAVFRNILACTAAEPEEEPAPGHAYVIGADWGKQRDFTALSVWDATMRREVWLDRFNRIDYAFQVERLGVLVDRYRPQAIIAERNSMGEPVIEQLARRGWPVVPFDTTNASKAVIIEALALGMEREEVQLLADPVATAELQAYEATRLPSGLLRYSAPEGMHDDTVMARALAHAVYAPGPTETTVVYDDPVRISPV
jgi:hypothetical protein